MYTVMLSNGKSLSLKQFCQNKASNQPEENNSSSPDALNHLFHFTLVTFFCSL